MPYEELKKKFPEEGGRCLKSCGKCCTGGVPLGATEANSIGEWLIKNKDYEDITKQFQHFDDQPAKCPFLTPEKTCFIYPVRPVVCVMFGHLPDQPDLPKKASQQCPEGVQFTQVATESAMPELADWFVETNHKMGRIVNFRNATFVGDEGRVQIPIKPGSKMDLLSKATACYWCGKTFEGTAYFESGELLCQNCEDNYEKGPDIHRPRPADGLPPA